MKRVPTRSSELRNGAKASGSAQSSRTLQPRIALDGFAVIRSAARGLSQKSRLNNALSIVITEVRVALAAAFLSAGRVRRQPCSLATMRRFGSTPSRGECACTHTHGRSSQIAQARGVAHICRSDPESVGGQIWLSCRRPQASNIAGPGATGVPTSPPRLLIEDVCSVRL